MDLSRSVYLLLTVLRYHENQALNIKNSSINVNKHHINKMITTPSQNILTIMGDHSLHVNRLLLIMCILTRPGVANPNDLAGHFVNTLQSCGPHVLIAAMLRYQCLLSIISEPQSQLITVKLLNSGHSRSLNLECSLFKENNFLNFIKNKCLKGKNRYHAKFNYSESTIERFYCILLNKYIHDYLQSNKITLICELVQSSSSRILMIDLELLLMFYGHYAVEFLCERALLGRHHFGLTCVLFASLVVSTGLLRFRSMTEPLDIEIKLQKLNRNARKLGRDSREETWRAVLRLYNSRFEII
ncbi:hypothetical protein AGLY_012188 [Aphis glycines]|uniref:Uncharacterized protein n=1 Tax=Aphis glycines TaxID=307491 RepID=A0A6G0T9E0_APHGL|nr:hypothetical protein AGLY_012188 [Aphis glycines]